MQNYGAVDTVIIVIFFISILAGLWRGFLKEVISLATWITATVVSSMFSAKLAASFGGASAGGGDNISMLSTGVSFAGIFIIILVSGSILNYIVAQATGTRGFSPMNRLGGGLFGALRAFLIVLVLIFLAELSPITEEAWWQQSRFVVSFQPAVKWLQDIVQPDIENFKTKMGGVMDKASSQLSNVSKSFKGGE